MNSAFFFQTKQIPENSSLFDEFKKQKIFFSYFQVNRNYYLFLYAQKSMDIDFLYHSVDVIQELDSKHRKIRSLRGFFLYALEIMEVGKNYEILETNLQPFFWKKVKNIIRQNKKGALHEFLFGSKHSGGEDNRSGVEGSDPDLDQQLTFLRETMKLLQTQVNSLQEKVIHLENQLTNIEDPLRSQNKAPEAIKIDQQSDSSLNPQSANLLPNDSEVRNPTSQRKGMESKSVSDDPKIYFKSLSSSQQ